MRRIVICVSLSFLMSISGCALPDALFNLLGDHYTGGGTTRAEKEYHFNAQIEAAQNSPE